MLREFYYMFLPYRSFLQPIFVMSAIVIPFWVAFRIYWLRRPGGHLSFAREILLLIFVLYLAGLAAVTLSPNRSDRLLAAGRGGIELRPNVGSLICSSPSLPMGSRDQAFCVHNARGNVMLFFPLGILIPLVWRNLRLSRKLLIVLGFSVGIELLQYFSSAWGSYRAADVNDVILNVFGACLGLAVASLLGFRRAGPGGQ